jgi:hypothetical protein
MSSYLKTNDKIPIRYGADQLIFVGLEGGIREFNEENINTIIDNIIALLYKKNMSKDEYYTLWESQHCLLKQDVGFGVEKDDVGRGNIIFQLTDAAEHRKNEVLMKQIAMYVDYVCTDENLKKSAMESINSMAMGPPKVPKRKKPKDLKKFELSTGITEGDVHPSMSRESNIDNILIMVGNNRAKNEVKMKQKEVEKEVEKEKNSEDPADQSNNSFLSAEASSLISSSS